MIEVVYSAFGKSFVRDAAISATSVKRHSPRLAISLVTGETVHCNAFDEVRLVKMPAESEDQARFAKTQKANAILSSSADRVLFLDADTYVCSDITGWFSVLDECDIALAFDTWRYSEIYRNLHPNIVVEEAPAWKTYFNTGVMFLKRSRKVDRFILQWSREFAGNDHLVRDQLVFQRLVYESGLRVRALPPEINVRAAEPIHLSGRVVVLHRAPFHGRGEEWGLTSGFLADFLNSQVENRVYTPHDHRLVVMGQGYCSEKSLLEHQAETEKEEYMHPSLEFASTLNTPAKEQSFRGTLYTSIPPNLRRQIRGDDVGRPYQKACIESWQAAGFDVVSVNSADEIEVLSSRKLNIRFVESAHVPPRIGDILSAARNDEAEIVGIINADCMIFAPEGIVDAMTGVASRGIVMAERMNLDPANLSVTGVSCSGFDVFLFGRWMIPSRNFDDEITIGTPWWDYWFPVHHAQEGGELFLVASPVLLHLDHDVNWNEDTYSTQRSRFHDSIAADEHAIMKLPFIKYDDPASEEELGLLGPATFDWLKTTATKVRASDDRSEFLLKFFAALNQPRAPAEQPSDSEPTSEAERDKTQINRSVFGQKMPPKVVLEIGKLFCTIGLKRVGTQLYNEANDRLDAA